IEDRHTACLELHVRLPCTRRGLRSMVVSDQGDDAAIGRCSSRVRMLECVATAVDPRTLAVPDTEDAVNRGTLIQVYVLRTPDGSRSKILVDARLEMHTKCLQAGGIAPQLEIVPTQGGPTIARDESSGLEPCSLIRPPL